MEGKEDVGNWGWRERGTRGKGRRYEKVGIERGNNKHVNKVL